MAVKKIKTVAVVGAGTMGHALAQVFAQGGYAVWLADVDEDSLAKARRMIASNLSTMVETGCFPQEEVPAVLGRIRTTTRTEEAGRDADFVIEAVIEDIAAKKELFKTLDRACPAHAILASNTSYLNIFEFVETNRPDKVLITHWFAPPHIIPLVEIVCGPQTSRATADTVRDLMLQLGKKPIVISKFLPGFIANRLQSALTQEVLFLIDNGYAAPEDIDEAAKNSFALRTPVLGLVKRFDFAGLDLTQKILRNRQYEPPCTVAHSPSVDRLVEQGRLGAKTGRGFYDYGDRTTEEITKERDVKLIKLREFLKKIGEL
jgi:3-hydroxybutyryl-CoA dehydrogenase